MRPVLIPGLAVALAIAASACAGKGNDSARPPPSWQSQISDPDRQLLAKLWGAWTRALAQADKAGMRANLAQFGNMVVPDTAVPAAFPGPGNYRCRTITIGIREGGVPTPGVPAMTTGQSVPCTITERKGLLWFEQQAGPQRIGGKMYADGDRMVFLGSMALAGEIGMLPYGTDGQRDQVGVLKAYGDRRWRIELPWPKWQSNLALIEILPA
ncbi:hypothetical protein GCM10011529_23280 [Polymorphobacter glacialis]|uniref:DUF4893 domain-containing protein n=1 Tax=Sandarakinorhabdus glacialis TaxID=1614636 RepID=A0A916ZWF9_9SPHN|nr:DUF4893 domain-containing protein [Polymorphobacter glacialis]GGE16232.1 hypothetical protein GCM10011529_23280 [Polymorphobacter glacialis]